jgi:sarcosine oxidase subunit delta
VIEFTYRGDATVVRPQTIDAMSAQAWTDYVYFRDNPYGILKELWYHGAGCHAWLVVTRDVRNHQIHAVQTIAQFRESETVLDEAEQ